MLIVNDLQKTIIKKNRYKYRLPFLTPFRTDTLYVLQMEADMNCVVNLAVEVTDSCRLSHPLGRSRQFTQEFLQESPLAKPSHATAPASQSVHSPLGSSVVCIPYSNKCNRLWRKEKENQC